MATSSQSFRLFFGLVLFLFFFSNTPSLLQAQEPATYAPTQWTNNISLNNVRYTGYKESNIIYPNGYIRSILLNDNSGTTKPSIACGFICVDPCNVFLFAVYSVEFSGGGDGRVANPLIIWSDNEDNPVGENATLVFASGGNLSLYDANGTSVWSPVVTSAKPAVGINITETGNLVLFDVDNTALWQSRDNPANAFFVGQELGKGQKLRRDKFYATVLYDGVYAFVDSNPPQISCFVRSEAVTSKTDNFFLRYENTSLWLYSGGSDYLLSNLVTAKSTFQYMSLEPNGHLKIYDWSSGWSITGDLYDQLGCLNPFECGVNQVSSGGKCTCLGTDTGNGSYFKYIDAGKPELGCSPVTRLDCGSMQDHRFLNLTEVAYFSYIDEEAAAFKRTDEQSCVQACSRNCSCRAALFKYKPGESEGYCYLPSQLLSFKTNNSTESGYHSRAHIKVQIASQSFALSPSPDSADAISYLASEDPLKKRSNVGVVLGSVLGTLSFLLLVSALILVIIRRRKQEVRRAFRKAEPLEEQMEQEEHFDEIPGMPTRFSYEQLAAATNNFAKKLGEGGFGSVFVGRVGNENIAVKLLGGVNQGRKEFLSEVQTIGKTHHFNLVRLIGFCADKSHRMLAYEYMPNGSLDRWIFNRDQQALSWQLRCKIIVDIARGLCYLHEECPQRIAHLDIKPQNILLDDKFNAKVSDFGLAKLIERDQTHVMTMMRGTPGYLAPEWLTSFITEKVDVYSFGVMVLEIVCRRKNLDPSQPSDKAHLVRLLQDKIKMDRLLDLVCEDEIGMGVDKDEAVQMVKLATWCLNHDPDRRPSMSTVVKVLEGVVNVATGVESDFIASIPAMQSEPYDLLTSSSNYASSASTSQSAALLSGPR